MAKTRRLIKESLPLVDAVTEILDARMPVSSMNPEIHELIGSKPLIVLLNKCDIADENATKQWLDYFSKQAVAVLAVDCRTGSGLNKYVPLLKEVLKDKIARNISADSRYAGVGFIDERYVVGEAIYRIGDKGLRRA